MLTDDDVVAHKNAKLFENPDERRFLMAPDLENEGQSWTWPNEPFGWERHRKPCVDPRDIVATPVPLFHGLHSGWAGCRLITKEEKVERRRELREAQAAEKKASARPAHRPPIPYDQKAARVDIRATNGDVLRWGRVANMVGLTLEDWILKTLREASPE